MEIIIVVIIVVVIGGFLIDKSKDSIELNKESLEKRFVFLLEELNINAFNGNGVITIVSKGKLNLYQDGKNQIIELNYFTGGLTVIWKFKYFQNEVILEKRFRDVSKLSQEHQIKMADFIIEEMVKTKLNHQSEVMGGFDEF